MHNSYKDNLVLEIKRYLCQYKEEFKANGQIEYYSCQNTNENKNDNIVKVIKTIGSVWGIIILAVASYLVYTELIMPQNIPISFTGYITIVLLVAMIIILSILFNATHLKRIKKLTINNTNISIYITNVRDSQEQQYLLNETEINIRKRRQTVKHTLKNKTYNVYIVHKKRKIEYLLTAENDKQFFAFVLFYYAMCKTLNIENLSDDELYEMYHNKLTQEK